MGTLHDTDEPGYSSGRGIVGGANEAWLDLGLLDSLAGLAAGAAAPVRALLDEPLQTQPEQLLCGMAAVRGDWGPLHGEVRASLPAEGG